MAKYTYLKCSRILRKLIKTNKRILTKHKNIHITKYTLNT